MPIQVEVEGLLEMERKLDQIIGDLRGGELRTAMRSAAVLVSNDAKKNAPVDSGRLRASITPTTRIDGTTIIGVVGSNVKYAPYMELGTGTFAGGSAYFPPPAAMNKWAQRHGFSSGWAVAYAIWKRGGVEGRHFLRDAYETNFSRIQRIIEDAVKKIVSQ